MEHNINVLPKWARKQIMDQQNQINKLKTRNIIIQVDHACGVVVDEHNLVNLRSGDYLSLTPQEPDGKFVSISRIDVFWLPPAREK